MAIDDNRIITFNYAKTNCDFFKKQTIPASNECMTKADINTYLNVKQSLLSEYVNSRLVPRVKVQADPVYYGENPFVITIDTRLAKNNNLNREYSFDLTSYDSESVIIWDINDPINTKYDIEEGNYIFKIYPENYESFIYIIAKKIKCNIINQNPFDFMENNK